MRDVERIDKVLNKIGNAWKQFPDLRLGQLLLNVESDILYYIEDEVLADRVEGFYKVENGNN